MCLYRESGGVKMLFDKMEKNRLNNPKYTCGVCCQSRVKIFEFPEFVRTRVD